MEVRDFTRGSCLEYSAAEKRSGRLEIKFLVAQFCIDSLSWSLLGWLLLCHESLIRLLDEGQKDLKVGEVDPFRHCVLQFNFSVKQLLVQNFLVVLFHSLTETNYLGQTQSNLSIFYSEDDLRVFLLLCLRLVKWSWSDTNGPVSGNFRFLGTGNSRGGHHISLGCLTHPWSVESSWPRKISLSHHLVLWKLVGFIDDLVRLSSIIIRSFFKDGIVTWVWGFLGL